MNPVAIRLSVLLITATVLMTGICCIPFTSADDDTEYGQYGATAEIKYDKFDAMIKAVSGKSITQWMQDLVNQMEGYNIQETPVMDLNTEFSITRDTVLKGNDYTITDHYSGWVNALFDGEATGCFPDAGTYTPEEGEDNSAFLERVFTKECTGDDKDIFIHSSLRIYIDVDLVSHVNMRTGYLNDSYLTIKLAMYERTDRNISFEYSLNDEKNIEYLTFGYDEYHGDSNFYLNFEIAMDFKDMPIFRSGSWTIYPSVTEHINKSVVSYDLADSLWVRAAGMSGDLDVDAKLPSLILELLGSGGRMMDIGDTIKSLTGKELPELTFMDVMNASEYTDDKGYWYCKLDSRKPDGNSYYLPKAGYVLRLADIVNDIPSKVLDKDFKENLVLFLRFVDWGNVEVKDISNNISAQEDCEKIRTYVNSKIVEDDVESYTIPVVYMIVAASGIGVSVLVIFLVRRRII